MASREGQNCELVAAGEQAAYMEEKIFLISKNYVRIDTVKYGMNRYSSNMAFNV